MTSCAARIALRVPDGRRAAPRGDSSFHATPKRRGGAAGDTAFIDNSVEKTMSGDTADTWVLEAARGACVRVRAARWSVLTVRSGYAWITVERDAADYWLAPGDALPLAAGERAWVGGWDRAVCCEVVPVGRAGCDARSAFGARAAYRMRSVSGTRAEEGARAADDGQPANGAGAADGTRPADSKQPVADRTPADTVARPTGAAQPRNAV